MEVSISLKVFVVVSLFCSVFPQNLFKLIENCQHCESSYAGSDVLIHRQSVLFKKKKKIESIASTCKWNHLPLIKFNWFHLSTYTA